MDAPPYWLSALAEEIAQLADNKDTIAVTALLRQHAKYHSISEHDLTAQVTAEWVRTGIVTTPTSGILRSWAE